MTTRRLLALSLLLPLACGNDPAGTSVGPGSSSGEPGTSEPGTSDSPSSTGPTPTTDDPTTANPTTATTGEPTTGEPGTSTTTTTTTATTGDTTTTTTTGESTGSDTTGDDTTGGALDSFLIGVHVSDVSPNQAQIDAKNLYMGAYGAPYTRGPAQGVHDPIFARSFALEAEGGALVMTIVDLPGMGNQNTRAVRQKAAELTGLDEGQILVGTTHSHSAPDLMGLWGGVPDGYRDFINGEIAASIAAAWDARQPAILRVGAAKAPNNNRRGWGFTDDDMLVLDAFDVSGQRLGTLVDFAAHPVILGEDNKLISCDYTGYTVQKLEAVLGAPAMLFNGTLGDASPKVPDGQYPDDFARAQAYGELLADIAAGIADTAEPIDPTIVWTHKSWDQSVENFLFQLAAQLGILQYDFEMMGLSQKVTTQSTYFRLGTQVQGVAFPGESLTRNGLAIKEVMTAPHKIILGNTGDALGYFIPSDEWQTGKNDNYEETVSLGKTAGDNARDHISELITADNF
jgi:hypothetical protein